MAEKFVSERNLKFMLYEVFDAESLLQYPYFADHSREVFDMVLDAAMKLGKNTLKPLFVEMDRNPPALVNGQVKAHPGLRSILKQFGEGGWIAASASAEHGGQQLPTLIKFAANFIFGAANYSAGAFPMLCTGAAHLITSFGSQEQIDTYVEKMHAGEWQGTMALTEPQAGSSLADVMTMATPTDQGYYKIKGQKIFISASDHDGADNIIHLLLAKIKGAPAGVKGISLFIVPKLRIEEGGKLVPNDISITATYHKLGYRGCPLNQLSLGENEDCRGYLVGEPHKGLAYMFQMMNESRIEVGSGAAAIASAAYYASLEYAKERPQGRKLANKDPNSPQIPIIGHPDIRRMLMFQRAVTEGAMSLLCQCSKYTDLTVGATGEEQERASLLLDFLTPVAKNYPSEMGNHSVSAGMQCLGGYGYCDEFPLEQHYRDARIHPIHEGTTGIQSVTILGRNVTMKNGQSYKLYLEEIGKAISEAQQDEFLKPYAEKLSQALDTLQKVTGHLTGIAGKGNQELFLADATLYMELFGIIAIAWQWLLQGLAARKALLKNPSEADVNFYQGKLFTCRFFFGYELPKIQGLATRLLDSDGLTLEMKEEYFAD